MQQKVFVELEEHETGEKCIVNVGQVSMIDADDHGCAILRFFHRDISLHTTMSYDELKGLFGNYGLIVAQLNR